MNIRFTMLSLAMFAASSAYAAETAAPKVDPAKGQALASTTCAACHGADGNSVIPTNPKLAGQIPEYLAKQLRNFKAGPDGKPERVNAVMNGMAAGVPDEDIPSIAAWFASQTQKSEAGKNDATLALGKKLWRAGDLSKGIPACAGCHGPAGAGLPAQYPRLSGQFSDYIEAQLKAFRSGERANDANKMMRTIALKMTDPEIKAVANYATGLR